MGLLCIILGHIDWPMQMNIMDMMDNGLYKDLLVGKMDLSSSVRVLMARPARIGARLGLRFQYLG